MGTPLEEKQFTYLLEAYKASVAYFDGYSGRVTARFNILFAVDVALAGALGAVLSGIVDQTTNFDWIIAVLGLVTSILLYIQSAQDKYLIRAHRNKINEIRRLIEEAIGVEKDKIPALFSPIDVTDTTRRNFIFRSPVSWRSNSISLTGVPVYTAILLIVLWVIGLFMSVCL
jgi:hypothetical protein